MIWYVGAVFGRVATGFKVIGIQPMAHVQNGGPLNDL